MPLAKYRYGMTKFIFHILLEAHEIGITGPIVSFFTAGGNKTIISRNRKKIHN
jgi:hypothetical protein